MLEVCLVTLALVVVLRQQKKDQFIIPIYVTVEYVLGVP
jgi:hypothetical protein